MRPHLRYALYVARHKWFVLLAGRRTGAPLWRLLVHDWSKLTPAEWGAYVEASTSTAAASARTASTRRGFTISIATRTTGSTGSCARTTAT